MSFFADVPEVSAAEAREAKDRGVLSRVHASLLAVVWAHSRAHTSASTALVALRVGTPSLRLRYGNNLNVCVCVGAGAA